jgi:hypothetical protein
VSTGRYGPHRPEDQDAPARRATFTRRVARRMAPATYSSAPGRWDPPRSARSAAPDGAHSSMRASLAPGPIPQMRVCRSRDSYPSLYATRHRSPLEGPIDSLCSVRPRDPFGTPPIAPGWARIALAGSRDDATDGAYGLSYMRCDNDTIYPAFVSRYPL